ncbi:MAG: MGMT family protein [Promethearchaeota archaeon]|nr:MAG: MGMT family protein [Candidatus Lokiarchaeota archaeon]
MSLEEGNLTSFQKNVLFLTQKIPKGKIATYGLLAKILGNIKLSRAVGNALNKNPFPITVPCHRVIRSDGFVGGFAKGTEMKVKLLKEENIEINQDNKINLQRYLINEETLVK